MAEHFTNSIGCLQQTAVPSSFPGFDKVSASPTNQPQEGMCVYCLTAFTLLDMGLMHMEHLD